MAQSSTLLSTLHGLSESLKHSHPAIQPVSASLLNAYGPGSSTNSGEEEPQPLTRESVQTALSGMREVLEKFKGVWEEGGEDARVRGAGKMKEWASYTAPLLSLAPTLHHLSTSLTVPSSPTNPLFPSPTPTPFAIPPYTKPAALLERTATSLGLEVFKETNEDNTQNTFASLPDSSSSSLPVSITTTEVLVLGGKALSIELELVESSNDQDNWTLAKIRSSITLEGDNSPLEHVDALLEPGLRRLLELMRPLKEGEEKLDELVAGETRELRAARELKEFERRLREVVRLEAGGKEGNLFSKGEEIRKEVDGWLQSKGCDSSNCSITPSPDPYPSYLISPSISTSPRAAAHKQVVHLVPTPSTSLPPRRLPSELLALTVDDQDASPTWGWEAVFEPALVVGVRGSSNSWGKTLLQQARSLSSPLPEHLTPSVDWDPSSLGTEGLSQRWSFAETPSTEGVAISRVGLSGVEEAGKIIEWARAWSSLNEFWLGVFDSPSSSSSSASQDDSSALDLDDLDSSFLAPPSNLPITLHLILPTPSNTTSHLPSILLSLPHPTFPLASLEITISPSLAGPLSISLSSPSSGSTPIEEARLAALGKKIGGWGQGVVKWVVERLGEKENGATDVVGSAEAKRKREESSGEEGGAVDEGGEEEERKRVKI